MRYPKNRNSNKIAELIGILLGDGYISYPKNPRVKISFNSIVDIEYLQHVKKLIESKFMVNVIVKHRKNENTSNLYVFKRKFIDYLLNDLELKPSPKWNRALIPKWVTYKLYVLRGLFDTDGCVVRTMNNGLLYPRLELKLCPSPMQKQVIEILSKTNLSFGVYDIGKGEVRIQMNGKKNLFMWYDTVGFSNIKHTRKMKQFIQTKRTRLS